MNTYRVELILLDLQKVGIACVAGDLGVATNMNVAPQAETAVVQLIGIIIEDFAQS
jgi:hypothetical protein